MSSCRSPGNPSARPSTAVQIQVPACGHYYGWTQVPTTGGGVDDQVVVAVPFDPKCGSAGAPEANRWTRSFPPRIGPVLTGHAPVGPVQALQGPRTTEAARRYGHTAVDGCLGPRTSSISGGTGHLDIVRLRPRRSPAIRPAGCLGPSGSACPRAAGAPAMSGRRGPTGPGGRSCAGTTMVKPPTMPEASTRRVADRGGELVTVQPAEELGQSPAELDCRVDEAVDQTFGMVVIAIARQSSGHDGRVVGPHRSAVGS